MARWLTLQPAQFSSRVMSQAHATKVWGTAENLSPQHSF